MTLKPAYRLTIGDKRVDTTDEPQASTVVDLVVALDMETPADSFTLIMGQVGSWRPQRDDEATIELGFDGDDDLVQVMHGAVELTEPGLTTRRVIGYSAAAKLLRTYADETYEGRTSAAIVRDLAAKAGVTVARATDGMTFPAYVIDGRLSAHRHMANLAALNGFDLYVNDDGELVFEPFTTGRTVHTFEYTKHILALDLQQSTAVATEVTSWGESPGGGGAEEAWAWLTKDFSGLSGQAGRSGTTQLLERPSLRTREAAQSAADALSQRLVRRTVRGRLRLTGQPLVKLGDAVRLRGIPDDALNATYQVRGVTHHLNKLGGFTTTVDIRQLG